MFLSIKVQLVLNSIAISRKRYLCYVKQNPIAIYALPSHLAPIRSLFNANGPPQEIVPEIVLGIVPEIVPGIVPGNVPGYVK